MKQYFLIPLAVAFLSGCLEKGQQDDGVAKAVKAVNAMEISRNSPDNTVKSWWRVKDAVAVLDAEMCKNYEKISSGSVEKLSELSTSGVYSGVGCSEKTYTFDRQITNVDVQSETRAIVTAQIRNTTPPEDGALLTQEDSEHKESGDAFQYVLERKDSKDEWRISQVSNMPSYSRSWQRIFKKPEPSNNRWVYETYQ